MARRSASQSDDLLKVETGSLYPALHRLEKKGWLKSEWGISEANHKAKYYQLTAAGKAQLSRQRDKWAQFVDVIGKIMNPAVGTNAMRPNDNDLDEEIRGHLAINVQQRIERGEKPEAARLAALREFGYVPQLRDEMRRVWYGRWFDMGAALAQDMRVGLRSLMRAKGMAATVVITLALGIGANAAIFSVVRGVLMRPLVNRDEARLVYLRQSATGLGSDNVTFSVPEIKDIRAGATTIEAFGEFSTVEFTLVGLGDPRVIQAGVVDGHYFDVMGLRPVIGRLVEPSDEGLNAAGVAVLTNRFWKNSLNSDPSVVGKTIQLGARSATVIGVLEPSIPYPADTEIIANMVTSPHHMGATMVTLRTHRMTQLFGRLKPGVTIEAARAEMTALHASIVEPASGFLPASLGYAVERHRVARSDCGAGAAGIAGAARRRRGRIHHRVLERRQPDPCSIGSARRRACRSRRAWRQPRCAATDVAGGEPRAVRRRRHPWRAARTAVGRDRRALCRTLLGSRARSVGRFHACYGWAPRSRWRRRCCSLTSPGCRPATHRLDRAWPRAPCASPPAPTGGCACSPPPRLRSVS